MKARLRYWHASILACLVGLPARAAPPPPPAPARPPVPARPAAPTPSPARVTAAAPACAGPAIEDPDELLPWILGLSRVIRDPVAVAARFDAVLAGPEVEAAALPRVVERYCEGHVQPFQPLTRAPTTDCDGARLILTPSGSVAWRPQDAAGHRTEPGSWCLAPRPREHRRDLNWGARAIVALRRADQLARDTQCYAATPGVVYRGPAIADDPYAAMEVKIWAGHADDALARQAAAAAADARQTLADAIAAFVHHKLASRLVEAAGAKTLDEAFRDTDPAALSADYCGPTAEALQDERAALCAAGGGGKPPAFARALQQVQSELPLDWNAMRATLHPAAQGVNGSIPGPVKARLCETAAQLAAPPLAARDKLDAAARRLTLLSQRAGEQQVPFPVLTAELPLGDNPDLVELTPLAHRRRVKIARERHGGDTVVAFVHDLQIGNDPAHPVQTAALFQGKQVVQDGTQLAEAFALIFKTVAAIEGVALPGAGAKTATAPCNKRDAPDRYRDCLIGNYLDDLEDQGQATGELKEALRPDGERDFARRIDELERLVRVMKNAPDDGTRRAFIEVLVLRIQEDGLLGNPLSATAETPSASLYSRMLRSDDVDAGYEYEVRICHDSPDCTAKTEDGSISASAIVKVSERHLVVGTATELSWGINLSSVPLGGYRFDPVGGPGGPQSFFALRSHDGVEDQTTFSQLVMFYPLALCKDVSWQGLALGAGPSLFGPDRSAFLKQWNLRAGAEIAPSLVLTAGVSARQIDIPAGRFQAGDIVAVAPGDKAPMFAQSPKWAWQISFGLSIDLAVVGKVIAGAGSSSQKSAASSGGGSSGGTAGDKGGGGDKGTGDKGTGDKASGSKGGS